MATLSSGSKIAYSADDTTYTNLTGVKGIDVPEEKYGKVDVTDLDTTGLKSYVPETIGEPGELSVELFWNATLFSTLVGFKGASKYWKVTFENGASDQTFKFQGFVTGTKAKIGANNEPVTMTLGVQQTTAATIA